MPFEHIIALQDRPGEADFPIYPADAFGYTGSIGLLLHELASPEARWLVVLRYAAFAIGITLFTTTIAAVPGSRVAFVPDDRDAHPGVTKCCDRRVWHRSRDLRSR